MARLTSRCSATLRRVPTSNAAAAVPYAHSIIAVEHDVFETIRSTVAALYRIAHLPAYQARVDVGADALARHRPPNHAVFMGYDFHLTADGPRLIEVNTNAGGALLNGLHTASLCPPEPLSCVCAGLIPLDTMRERLLGTFRAEFAAARPGAPLTRVAIADDRPGQQFLRAEFALFREFFREVGILAEVCDVRALEWRPGAGLWLHGEPVDLVYLRDTDWLLEQPRSAALRAAYLADEMVATPSPREHHLLAHKARLELFSSEPVLRELGATPAEIALLADVVPETIALDTLGIDTAWRTRRGWVFKPGASHASRAVYRGDKISRRKLDEIAAIGGFVAQRRIEPGALEVATLEGPRRMNFDVRAYAYRNEILLLGARVYEGQVTNFRTAGGGFSAICVVRGVSAGPVP